MRERPPSDRVENPPMRKLRRLPAEKGCFSSTLSISSHVSRLWPFFFMTKVSHSCPRNSSFAWKIGKSAQAMLEDFAGDEEVVGHSRYAQQLLIKWRGILRRLAPHRLDAQIASRLYKRIKHARSDAPHLAARDGDGIRMHGGKIYHDVMAPRATAEAEPQ